ncbi:hypothetical protein [Cryobacterium breve]|uniref:hypothetical protein n=1 Tax=Cryobacterium breve TaxID=1259258 RepID=UPI00248B3E95|nr:hypothetical protein [Cryobacterium breve]
MEPCPETTSASVSTNGTPRTRATRLPTLVFPAAIGPINTSGNSGRSLSPAGSGTAGRSGVTVPP